MDFIMLCLALVRNRNLLSLILHLYHNNKTLFLHNKRHYNLCYVLVVYETKALIKIYLFSIIK